MLANQREQTLWFVAAGLIVLSALLLSLTAPHMGPVVNEEQQLTPAIDLSCGCMYSRCGCLQLTLQATPSVATMPTWGGVSIPTVPPGVTPTP